MDSELRQLMKTIPPPDNPRCSNVNWNRLQQTVGLTYPTSFKEFINVYGGSVWFDNLSPIFDEAQSDSSVQEFLDVIANKLSPLQGNTYDQGFRQLSLPHYPEAGGLLPFLIDYGGGLFCWKTDVNNPDRWPVVFWDMGPVRVLDGMTVAGMIIQWLQRQPEMIEIWGDVDDYEPERIRITES